MAWVVFELGFEQMILSSTLTPMYEAFLLETLEHEYQTTPE
jgi:hypothetical protein